jgi:hypothetical protein
MGSYRSQVILGVWVAGLIAPAVSSSRTASAQPSSGSAHAETSARTAAKKLVEEGNAAYNAKDYGKAISFYMRAFAIEPHPRLLFNIGQALRLAGCIERAVFFYERYLALEFERGESDAARGALTEIRSHRSPGSSVTAPVSSTSCSVVDGLMDVQSSISADSKGRLKVSSTPAGMIVMLDGSAIGITPIERDIAVGEHTVVLVNDGVRVGERAVKIVAGAILEETIPISYSPTNVRYHPSPGPSRVVPMALFGGAGVALAVSPYMFYLGRQGGPDRPDDRYRYPNANRIGFMLVGAGAAAIGVGMWLWLREPRERDSAPVAAISPGGGYFGWQERF